MGKLYEVAERQRMKKCKSQSSYVSIKTFLCQIRKGESKQENFLLLFAFLSHRC